MRDTSEILGFYTQGHWDSQTAASRMEVDVVLPRE